MAGLDMGLTSAPWGDQAIITLTQPARQRHHPFGRSPAMSYLVYRQAESGQG
jgi:hypothetical protein